MNLENLNLAELNALELQETNGGIGPLLAGLAIIAGTATILSSGLVIAKQIIH